MKEIIIKKLLFISLVIVSANGFANDRFKPGVGAQAKCVYDQKTHLLLEKRPASIKYSWQDATNYVKSLKLCGYTNNWRLATKEEQIALQGDAGDYAPFAWFNTNGFDNIQTDFYWSTDTFAKNNKDAWGIFMYSGKIYNEPKSGLNYVWPVRSMQ